MKYIDVTSKNIEWIKTIDHHVVYWITDGIANKQEPFIVEISEEDYLYFLLKFGN